MNKIIEYEGKFWINLSDLRKIGFTLPSKGTRLLWTPFLRDYEMRYKFFESRDGWTDGVFISPFATTVGEKYISYSELYVEFNKDSFIKNY